MPALSPRLLLLAAALTGVCAYAIVRAALVDRRQLRRVETQLLWFKAEPVGRGQTLTRSLFWQPHEEVFVVGWNPALAAPAAAQFESELALYDDSGKTRIFVFSRGQAPPSDLERWDSADLPDGTGYRVERGGLLTLRLRVTNTGSADFWTEGGGALIRFVRDAPSKG
jgi:hypothetical protein